MRLGWILAVVACNGPEQIIVVHTTDEGSTPWAPDDEEPPTTDPPVVTSEPDPDGPAIADFQVVVFDTHLQVSLLLDRGTAPLDGGAVLVDYDGVPLALAIPEDLTSFDGESATFLLERPRIGLCTEGADHAVAVEVRDARDRSSGAQLAVIPTYDVGYIATEIGESQAWILGTATAGLLVCGELDSTGNDGTAFIADIDYLAFDVAVTERWTFQLDWDVIANFDLLLYTLDGEYLDRVNEAAGPDVHGPEILSERVLASEAYVLGIGGWSGAPGTWSLSFL